ncbi:MAG: HAD family hydrolase [Prevotellaceae bacterium]|jgi:putative hydrolase of the HAD superfamily|nr:HAD family hydrolase [Prevotellaceae bacterium]
MLKKNNIKGLLFDYGGTIDTNGVHWAVVLWQYYRQLHIPVTHEAFKEAYVHGERSLALYPLIKPKHSFYNVLLIKLQLQINYLIEHKQLDENARNENYSRKIARACYEQTRETIEQAKVTLELLSNNYPVVLVSNFYGNINTVLKNFGIQHYFKEIIESAVVGVRKPDPAIWTLGVNALGVEPDEVAVIGDSYTKDIISGKQAGCQTIWLDVSGWEKLEDISQADEIITNFTSLTNILS